MSQVEANDGGTQRSDLPWSLGLDFLKRVYRTSLVLVVFLGLLIAQRFGRPAAVGWLIGSGVSLAVLVLVEWSVRRLVRSGSKSVGSLLGMSVLKLIGVTAILVGTYYCAMRGWVAVIWLLPGFMLPHAVIVLKVIGIKLRSLSADTDKPPGG